MLKMIDEPNGNSCLRILKENLELFQLTPGSTNNHQNWPGGYLDHVQEAMNIAILLRQRYENCHSPFQIYFWWCTCTTLTVYPDETETGVAPELSGD